MCFRLISFTAAVLSLAATSAKSQPAQQQIICDTQICTFTLAFDDGMNRFEFSTGAPYSGQRNSEQVSTMDNGAHLTFKTPGPLTYRDSDGRTRTEQSAYPRRSNGQPPLPDDFTITEIRDPVAGFQYVLDPVTQVAHRMAFAPGTPQQWQPSYATEWAATTEPPLGTESISGIATVGYRAGNTEYWVDQRTGVPLLSRQTGSGYELTYTMLNYSNAEPDPAFFRIPEGYQVIDETGPFKVVHPRSAPARGVSGIGQFGLSGACEEESCTLTYNPPPQISATTGGPYSGRDMVESPAQTLADGTQIPARNLPGMPAYRDSNGDFRTEMRAPVRRAPGEDFRMVRIQDAVNGYVYLLDSINHVAYRMRVEFRTAPVHAAFLQQPPGTRTLPNGIIVTDEDLGAQTISGVSALGHRTTQTNPPGTFNENDKAIVTVSEVWTDPKTGVALILKTVSANNANTRTISDYNAGDPDPALFLIPPEYKVVDETGKFTFSIPR